MLRVAHVGVGGERAVVVGVAAARRVGRAVVVVLVVVVVRAGRRRVQAVQRVVRARHGRGALLRVRLWLRRRRRWRLLLLRRLLPELHEGGFGRVLAFRAVSHRSHGHHQNFGGWREPSPGVPPPSPTRLTPLSPLQPP